MLIVFLVNIILIINLIWLKSTIIGAVFLVFYLGINGWLAGKIIKNFLKIKDQLISCAIGLFIVFNLIAFFSGAVILFYQWNRWLLSIIIFVISVSILYICKLINLKIYAPLAQRFKIKCLNFKSFFTPIYIALILLFIIGFVTLYLFAAPKQYIISPWQILPNQFAWVFFLLAVIILVLVFYHPKKYLLVFIILFSLLQHLYLPAVYRLPYGLDDWRHIGKMQEIKQTGNVISTYHTDGQNITSTITNAVNKSSYVSFWGAGLFLHQVLNINLVELTPWWQAIFFAVFLPILMWLLGKVILEKNSSESIVDSAPFTSLTLAFLPALFYPMQLYGAISLPVGFNFLLFLLFLITVFTRLKHHQNRLKYLLVIEFILLLFGYVIYWLIAGLIIGFVIIIKYTQDYHQSIRKKLIRVGYLLASILFIPIISLWASPNARFDILTTGLDYFRNFFIHEIQIFFGLKALGSMRPQAGNLIWHDLRKIFVDTRPFNWQYFDTFLLVIFIVFLILGLREIIKKAEQLSNSAQLILYLFAVSISSIFLDRYYFGGIHLLTERIDLIVDLSLILILIMSIIYLVKKVQHSSIFNFKFLIAKVFLIVIISFTVVSTYISGPVYGRATYTQHKAVKWLWQQMQENNHQNYCVLAEHFSLAPLEAVSGGQIINGNFPIQYGYLEKSGQLFINFFSNPDQKWLNLALKESGASGCYILIDERFLARWNITQIRWILGKEIYDVDDIHIWRYYDDNAK